MPKPLVSVIMPVYNAQNYVEEAILSILNQTYQNFEFIIINDGSTDRSLEIIKKYAKKDDRIKVISRENKGLIYSLNEGIKISKGKYIARMDADDISLPNRFEKQIELMEKENIDICGGHYIIVDENGKYLDTIITPISKEAILINLSLNVPFAHGSVMINRRLFNELKYGDTIYHAVEDFALWQKFYKKGYKFGNVDEFIFKYREFSESFSKTKLSKMEKDRKELSSSFIKLYKEDLENSIDIQLNKSLSIWEQKYLGELSLKLKYKIIKTIRQIDKKVFMVNVLKYLGGKI